MGSTDGCSNEAKTEIETGHMNDRAHRADRYLILIEGGPPSNYSAWSPDLPGCVATGETLEEAEQEMRRAIKFHLAGLAEDGAEIRIRPDQACMSSARR